MSFPSFAETLSSKSGLGVAKETAFRTPVAATAATPFDSCTLEETPGTFSPPTMAGVISTDIYPMQGDIKVAGAIGAPLYALNGVPMLVGSVGQDATTLNGVTGTAHLTSAGTPGSAGSSTSFAATGVTSITLTGISGTFAATQVLLISGSTDTAGPETVVCSVFSTPTVTCSATKLVHTGTITVSTVGAVSSGSVSAGGSTITLATGMGALFTTNDVVQIDLNGTATAESHKITKSSDTLTIADASPNDVLKFAHLTAIQVINVTGGLFLHTVPSGALDGFTVERNIGGVQSLQFPGCRFSKGALACPSGNNPAKLTIDVMGAAPPIILATPTVTSITTDPPFQFAEATLTVFGAPHSEAYNLACNWDNVVKETPTYSQSHYPSFLTKTDLHVGGTFDAIWNTFDDATYGFWSKMNAQTQGALTFKLTHASDGSYINVNFPLVVLDKAGVTTTVGNVVMQPLSFKGFYNITTAQANMVLTVANSSWLPY